MQNKQNFFLLLYLFIGSYQFSNASDALNHSALLAADAEQQATLEKFNKGNDDKTEEAAKLALLLIANGPARKAEVERETHTQTYKNGRELMVIGGALFTFSQGLNFIPLSSTSYYTQPRNDFSLVSSWLGVATMAGGLIQYHYGKWRLNKMQKNK